MDDATKTLVGEMTVGPDWADDDEASSKIRQAVVEDIDRKRRDGLPVVVNRGHGVEILQPGEY